MPDRVPGHYAIQESEEVQIWATGPDNNHGRYQQKVKLKSTITDSGNTNFTTTIRGGNVISLKDSDGLGYLYDPDANDGTQKVVGILEKHTSMLDPHGTAEDKFTKVLTSGIIKNYSDLLGEDLAAAAVLTRIGFRFAQVDPHGSAFLLHPKAVYWKDGTALSGAYTVVAADHGCMLVATTAAMNFTLPSLASVGPGFSVLLYNAVDADMIITGAANTIVSGDAGGALSTTITFSTANAKMGGQALMYSHYAAPGGSLAWFPLFVTRTPTTA